MSFVVKFGLIAEWFDARLTWNDLNSDEYLNIPDEKITEKLWVPIIIFDNTESKYETPVDKKTLILVKKQGNAILSPIQEMEEIAYYKGAENCLKYTRDFFLRFKCNFELQHYPFDSQTCTMLLKKASKFEKFMNLIPRQLEYSGPVNMAEFVIIDTDIKRGDNHSQYDIQVSILMKRRISHHLLSTYLPSLCILIVAQVAETSLLIGISLFRCQYILPRNISRWPSPWPSRPCWSCSHSKVPSARSFHKHLM